MGVGLIVAACLACLMAAVFAGARIEKQLGFDPIRFGVIKIVTAVAHLIAIAILVAFPNIILWLPSQMGR